MASKTNARSGDVDSPYAWLRLATCLALATIGGVGMWSIAVVLPLVQAEFGVARGSASLPYTLTMIGVAVGGIGLGRLSDSRGIAFVATLGAVMLAIGFVAASQASSLMEFALIQGAVIGALGTSATFGPLVADISHWFVARRGLAVALCASGNYVAGAIWPPILQRMIEAFAD